MTQKDSWIWYVAGPWDHREQVREHISKVQAAGWSTCSRWAEPDNPDVDPDDPEREAKLRFQAMRDVEDVIKADGLIYINSKMSEGKATELGISIAMLKPIVIVGSRERNIFLHLNIPCHPTIEEALEWLDGDGRYYLEFVVARQEQHLLFMGAAAGSEEPDIEFPSE